MSAYELAPPRYAEKVCVECGAPFQPRSGRQRYCELHRQQKFDTARDTEHTAARRAHPQWRAPGTLPIFEKHDYRRRHDWVAQALRLARRLGDTPTSRELVGWAERTALGEVEVLGCHNLGQLVDAIEFELYMLRQCRRLPTPVETVEEPNADILLTRSPAETRVDMSVSGWWRTYGYEFEADAVSDSITHGWAWVRREWSR